MGFRVDSVPYPVDASVALFGLWRVPTPADQLTAVEAIGAAWQARPWPGAGLSSYAVLVGDDGATLLHFSQLDDPDTAPDQDLTWKHEVDAAVPGIERLGVTACRLHRRTPFYGRTEDAGCVVLVTREFDSPDVARAEKLVDAMFAGSAQTTPAAGMIAAHFFVSLDGARVFNYALWTSADAHQQAIDNVPAQLAADEQWQQAHSWPGLLTTTFQRFRPHLLLARPES